MELARPAPLCGDSRTTARRASLAGPQTAGRARLHLSFVCHQSGSAARGNLARLQPPRRHGKSHRGTETRSGGGRFLLAGVLCHRGSFSRHPAAVQFARRISARQPTHRVSPTRPAAHSGFSLRRSAGPRRTPFGPALVRLLGRPASTQNLAGKRLTLHKSNFAEVASSTRNLNPKSVK